jgi:hypothetical protein
MLMLVMRGQQEGKGEWEDGMLMHPCNYFLALVFSSLERHCWVNATIGASENHDFHLLSRSTIPMPIRTALASYPNFNAEVPIRIRGCLST